jgi:hypothetical protein
LDMDRGHGSHLASAHFWFRWKVRWLLTKRATGDVVCVVVHMANV